MPDEAVTKETCASCGGVVPRELAVLEEYTRPDRPGSAFHRTVCVLCRTFVPYDHYPDTHVHPGTSYGPYARRWWAREAIRGLYRLLGSNADKEEVRPPLGFTRDPFACGSIPSGYLETIKKHNEQDQTPLQSDGGPPGSPFSGLLVSGVPDSTVVCGSGVYSGRLVIGLGVYSGQPAADSGIYSGRPVPAPSGHVWVDPQSPELNAQDAKSWKRWGKQQPEGQ